jgi:hypothetical protein
VVSVPTAIPFGADKFKRWPNEQGCLERAAEAPGKLVQHGCGCIPHDRCARSGLVGRLRPWTKGTRSRPVFASSLICMLVSAAYIWQAGPFSGDSKNEQLTVLCRRLANPRPRSRRWFRLGLVSSRCRGFQSLALPESRFRSKLCGREIKRLLKRIALTREESSRIR